MMSDDHLIDLVRAVREAYLDGVREGERREREACALEAESYGDHCTAAAIRSRG